jgi:CdiI N-terminal domain
VTFSICFTDKPNQYLDDDPSIPSAIGRITAGQLDEEFVSSLYEWDKETYERQWLDSLQRFVNGANKAVLITWYVNSKESSNLQWWALYRGANGVVHVQNHLPWYHNFGREFSAEDATSFLHDRIAVNEDWLAISEWNFHLSDIEVFLAQFER